MRRIHPTGLFFTKPYLQSSIPISVHLTQRGRYTWNTFLRAAKRKVVRNYVRATLDELNIPMQGETDLPLYELCEYVSAPG